MNRLLISATVVLAVATFGQRTSAQVLTSSLFERYLESLREQAGIPGMSALVLQDGVVVWEQGFGRADLESGERAQPYTPYLIGALSQMFGATLLLRNCVEPGLAGINDPVAHWVNGFPEQTTTLGHLMAHVGPANEFKYDRARVAFLTPAIEACARARSYRKLLDDDVLVRLGMADSAPGMLPYTLDDRTIFDAGRIDYVGSVRRRIATPYGLERGRMVRTMLAPTDVDAAAGVVSSVRDLARFDAALTDRRDPLLQPATRDGAWRPAAPHLPTGLGWFVQSYNDNLVVWQFGVVPDAYSSLIIKVPERRLTFILLANSDSLSTPFALENGDVTASLFARLFLRLYLP